jgi:hypothetical protein
MICGWVAYWARTEAPTSLGLVRLLLGLVILYDLLVLAGNGLVLPLFAPREAGGISVILNRDPVPELYRWLPATATTARLAFGLALGLALAFTVGLFTRLSGLLLVLLLAQLALMVPPADRGVDMLLRNAVLLLSLSPCGQALSLDAWRRSGSLWGDGRPAPAWARSLLVVQLTLLYSGAGMLKLASSWLPPDWSALWVALRDPAYARDDWPWLDRLFPLTQAATAITWLWEWGAPLILLAFWYRQTAERPGRLRAAFNRARVLELYLGVGALFHLGTHLGLNLGIFPFAVLALYPAAVAPSSWERLRPPRDAPPSP